jgi:hypothetical protein
MKSQPRGVDRPIVMLTGEAVTTSLHSEWRLVVDAAPDVVVAGGALRLLCRVEGAAPRDLIGRDLRIQDETGGVIAASVISTNDDGDGGAAAFELTAPVRAGNYHWSATITDTVASVAAGAPIISVTSFVVQPQETLLTVWDVPSTLVAGQVCTVKVGVKGSAAGSMAGTLVTIHDGDGSQISAAQTSDTTLPGSDGLHVVELKFSAPEREGLHRWEARASGAASPISRTDASIAFAARVVPHPDVSLTVEIFGAEDGAPIRNATVVLHPYRGLTNTDGVAVLRVASGNYTLFVSARGHESASWPLAIMHDVAWRAPLVREPEEDLSRGYV